MNREESKPPDVLDSIALEDDRRAIVGRNRLPGRSMSADALRDP